MLYWAASEKSHLAAINDDQELPLNKTRIRQFVYLHDVSFIEPSLWIFRMEKCNGAIPTQNLSSEYEPLRLERIWHKPQSNLSFLLNAEYTTNEGHIQAHHFEYKASSFIIN